VGAAFSAQLDMADERRPVDVLITLDGRRVAMRAGDDTIGRWRRGECQFEQRGQGRYDFHAEGETLSLEVSDPTRFQRALMVVWQERRVILPWRLLAVTGGMVLAMVGAAALGLARPAPDASPEVNVSPPVSSSPVTSPPAPEVEGTSRPPSTPVVLEPGGPVSAESLVTRWNSVSPSTRLAVPAPGATRLGTHLKVELADGAVTVEAAVTGDADRDREAVAAMGMAIAVLDPDLPPSDRKDVLANLGLDLEGANPEPLDRTFAHRGVEYRLVYRPGASLVLTAST
jgi:hypothetical protein